MEKGLFSFSKRGRQAEDRSLHQPRRPRSPPRCVLSMERGSGTRKVVARKQGGEHKCAFQECPGSEGCGAGGATHSEEPLSAHQKLGAGPAGQGGAEQRATLGALGKVRTRAASLAPAPAGSMTPRWLAGRGGVA